MAAYTLCRMVFAHIWKYAWSNHSIETLNASMDFMYACVISMHSMMVRPPFDSSTNKPWAAFSKSKLISLHIHIIINRWFSYKMKWNECLMCMPCVVFVVWNMYISFGLVCLLVCGWFSSENKLNAILIYQIGAQPEFEQVGQCSKRMQRDWVAKTLNIEKG